MVEIYNKELLDMFGLLAYCDENSVTLYSDKQATNGFKDGDIIISIDKKFICRYKGYELSKFGSVVLTDAFLIKNEDGVVDKHIRFKPQSGIGYVSNFKLAENEDIEYFNEQMQDADI